jgi:hypothetical protein
MVLSSSNFLMMNDVIQSGNATQWKRPGDIPRFGL